MLSQERVGDKPAAAAAVEEATSGEATATTTQFSALLLGGNPGIGAGALGALWGGSGSGSSGRKNGLFPFLLRLELSRCGLTAVDLAGFSSPANGDGGVHASSSQASAVVCLRALVLRDNPLTRVREEGGGGGGAQSLMEQARRGAAALRDLIARAPGLEVLDVSGEESSPCRWKRAPNTVPGSPSSYCIVLRLGRPKRLERRGGAAAAHRVCHL